MWEPTSCARMPASGGVFVRKLPVTADGKVSASTTGLSHVVCSCHVSGETRGEGSCVHAARKLPPKSGFEREPAVADHHKQVGAMLASSSRSVVARLDKLAVEPTFLT